MQIPTERDAQRTQAKHKQSIRGGDVDCDVSVDASVAAAWAIVSLKVPKLSPLWLLLKGLEYWKLNKYDDIHMYICLSIYQYVTVISSEFYLQDS